MSLQSFFAMSSALSGIQIDSIDDVIRLEHDRWMHRDGWTLTSTIEEVFACGYCYGCGVVHDLALAWSRSLTHEIVECPACAGVGSLSDWRTVWARSPDDAVISPHRVNAGRYDLRAPTNRKRKRARCKARRAERLRKPSTLAPVSANDVIRGLGLLFPTAAYSLGST